MVRLKIRYIYDGLYVDLAINPDSSGPKTESIFQPCAKDSDEGHMPVKMRLKPSIGFHLYISCAPCGDASILESIGSGEQCNSFTGAKIIGDREMREDRQTVGLLRSKSCRSTIQRPDQSLSMSCSDKILRWNWIGIGEFKEQCSLEFRGNLLLFAALSHWPLTLLPSLEAFSWEPWIMLTLTFLCRRGVNRPARGQACCFVIYRNIFLGCDSAKGWRLATRPWLFPSSCRQVNGTSAT